MKVDFADPSPKSQILTDAGYRYNFDRRLYLNRKQKKAFSLPFLESHSEAEIERYVSEKETNGDGWHFFFNEPPTTAVIEQLAALLD